VRSEGYYVNEKDVNNSKTGKGVVHKVRAYTALGTAFVQSLSSHKSEIMKCKLIILLYRIKKMEDFWATTRRSQFKFLCTIGVITN